MRTALWMSAPRRFPTRSCVSLVRPIHTRLMTCAMRKRSDVKAFRARSWLQWITERGANWLTRLL